MKLLAVPVFIFSILFGYVNMPFSVSMNCDLSVKWSGRHWAYRSKPRWQ